MSDPAQILEVSTDGTEAIAWSRDATRTISLMPLTLEGRDVGIGDWVLTSAGLAVERLEESEARELLSIARTTREEEGTQP